MTERLSVIHVNYDDKTETITPLDDISAYMLDKACNSRRFTVRYDYEDSESTYHAFFSERGARESIAKWFADDWGDQCLLMDNDIPTIVTRSSNETEAPTL